LGAERYLLVRFSSLGDVVLATAAANYIKAQRPQARIVFATKENFAPLLEGHPSIDEVWPLEGPQGLELLSAKARASGFTALLDLHANLRSRWLGLRSGLPVFRWQAGTLDRRLRVWLKAWKRPELPPVVSRYVAAAAAMLGEPAPPEAPLPTLKIDAASEAWAAGWLRARGWQGEALVAVAPGAAWPSKRTSIEILRESLKGLPQGTRLLLVGSAAERGLCEQLAEGSIAPLNAAGETGDLRQLLALIGKSRAFLGHDSGPLHLAEALGIPCTALFGPTIRAFGFFPQGPGHRVFERDLDCRPCSVHGTEVCPLGHHHCLLQLQPDEIAGHLKQVLERAG
jgi:heptosyltransferase-2